MTQDILNAYPNSLADLLVNIKILKNIHGVRFEVCGNFSGLQH